MKMNQAALAFLNSKKKSKTRDLLYIKLKPQQYITSGNFSEEQQQLLFALRSKMLRVKSNFSGMYKHDKLCSLGCKVQEDEEHLINCKYLVDHMSDSYILADIGLSDVFGTLKEQKQIAEAFVELLKIREKITSES